MTTRGAGFWLIQIPGWLLLAYLVYAQAIPAFDYELGVAMGTQESAETITPVGAAFWYGFALGDLVIYIPLLAAGLIGLWKQRDWSRVVMGAALGITVYWPIVSIAAVVTAQGAPGWSLVDLTAYRIVLSIITIWGLWSLWWLTRVRSYRNPE